MNSFVVQWDPDAEEELARFWLGSNDRPAITRAQAQADTLLSRDPYGGQHMSEGLYRLEAPPLVFTYTIDDANQTVTVTGVRLIV
jgi:hypothetical protein